MSNKGLRSYKTARYFAISAIGYGKGFTQEEALENYVKTIMRDIPVSSTVFDTRKEWEEALRSGVAQAQVWIAPEGWDGFLLAFDGLSWKRDVKGKTEYRKAQITELVYNPERQG